ncbi:MAG: thiamine pyrophosphate-binding protein [Frankiaceae bacterium]
MACGHAKVTGRLGVCCATSGPGAIHLLNGLYDAKLDHVPVLALTGMQETSVLGTRYQQEVHLDRLFSDVAAYNLMVTNPRQMPPSSTSPSVTRWRNSRWCTSASPTTFRSPRSSRTLMSM